MLLLHEELSRLPRKYRDPIILHYLEFRTRDEIASQLDTTDASIKARLARARRLLRSRLMRRGVAFSIAVSLTREGFSHDLDATQRLAEQLTWQVSRSMDGKTTLTRSESLAYQEIGKMRLHSLTRSLFAIVPAVCLLFVLGIGWKGQASVSEDDVSRIRVDITPDDDSPVETRVADTVVAVGQTEAVENEFTPADLPTIQSGDMLGISVFNSPVELPIHGLFEVEPTGKVALGPFYGRVLVGGLNAEEAEKAIEKSLSARITHPQVSVTYGHLPGQASSEHMRARQGKLQPGDLLRLRIGEVGTIVTIVDETIAVEVSGQVALPFFYRRIPAARRTVESLESDVMALLLETKTLRNPAVLITRTQAIEQNVAIDARFDKLERLLGTISQKPE